MSLKQIEVSYEKNTQNWLASKLLGKIDDQLGELGLI